MRRFAASGRYLVLLGFLLIVLAIAGWAGFVDGIAQASYDSPNPQSNVEAQPPQQSNCDAFPAGNSTLNLGTLNGAQISVDLIDVPQAVPAIESEIEGYCHYRIFGCAKINIKTGGGNKLNIDKFVEACDIDFYKKSGGQPNDPQLYRNISLTYQDSETSAIRLLENFPVGFKLYEMDVTFDTAPGGNVLSIVGGSITIQLDADGEYHVGGPVYLGGDLTSLITYSWGANSTSWTSGTWDFSGAAELELSIRRGGVEEIAAAALNINSNGIGNLTFTYTGGSGFDVAGFRVKLSTCTLIGQVSLQSDDPLQSLKITGGQLRGSITGGKPLDGSAITGTVAWQSDNNFRMSIDPGSILKVCKAELTTSGLNIDFTSSSFEFTRIYGNVGFKLPGAQTADASLNVQFDYGNGKLNKFLGTGNLGYKGFGFNVSKLEYLSPTNTTGGYLAITAKLTLGWDPFAGEAEVTDFKLKESGEVSISKVHASVTGKPITATFDGYWNSPLPNSFQGKFSAKFAGNADVSGEILLGTAGSDSSKYTFGYFKLAVNVSKGIPIGTSGLKLIGLNGAFGYNYSPPAAPAPPSKLPDNAIGTPESGTKYFAAGATIGDVSQIAKLNLTIGVNISATDPPAIHGSGLLSLPQSEPHYFNGGFSIDYELGSTTVSGSVATQIKVPASGSIINFSADNNTVNFKIGDPANKYSLTTPNHNLGGTFFNTLTLSEGDISLSGNLDSPLSSMTGRLHANLSGSKSGGIKFPPGFNPNNTSCFFGLGFSGNFTLTFSGAVDANLNKDGTVGKFSATIDFNGNVATKVPLSPVKNATWTAHGTIEVEKSGSSQLHVKGSLSFLHVEAGTTENVSFDFVTGG